jgi:GT2 family glycosyltransferase
VEVSPGWLEPLVRFMEEHEQCGLCTPKVLDINRKSHFEYAGAAGGYIDRFGYPFCRGRIFDILEEDRGQYDRETEIFWGTGACLMVRASLYHRAGGLDEQFFAHMEEIDLCWRIKRMGYTNYCIPASTVYHVGGGTLSYDNPRKTFLNFRNNLLLLYKNLPVKGRGRVLLSRMLLDGISALRFLLRGSFGDFVAVIRAHGAYYGMKKAYKGTEKSNISDENNVIVSCIYPGSIVADFFLKGKKTFNALGWNS